MTKQDRRAKVTNERTEAKDSRSTHDRSRAEPRIRSGVKAGGIGGNDHIEPNHNQTMVRAR